MGANAPPRKVVVVGASAGGVEALKELVAGLPKDLGAAILVVLHVSPNATSRLPEILSRAGPLSATHPVDGTRLEEGHVYVAPPDRHLIVNDGRVRVVRGPHENLHRPAIDPLFRSAALTYGGSVVAVVLSGTREDGAAGAAAVSRRGGTVVVQDPEEAFFPDMPLSAIAADHPDYVLPVAEIAMAIGRLVAEPPKEGTMGETEEVGLETHYAAMDAEAMEREEAPGERSPYSCPSCGGGLWEAPDEDMLRFRCRVGHAFSADNVLDGQGETLDVALWTALRALQERAQLARRIAVRLRGRGMETSARRYDVAVEESEREAEVIRAVLAGRNGADG